MSDTKRVIKWWSAWRPEEVEAWLEAQEAEGWQLVGIKGAATRFYFQKGETRRLRYCVDYQTKQDTNYIQIFEDSGWELIFSRMGWYFWRMSYSGERPEIYSDPDSLIERNNKLMTLFIILATIQMPIIVANMNLISKFPYVLLIYAIIFGFMGYGIVQLISINKRLKQKKADFK